ncbi:MAG: uracil-DNA glycosylase family protein [Campylobacterota bacterium]|nr:uracil-DNA glycosylase family protein [Campylobacterota bacterium]
MDQILLFNKRTKSNFLPENIEKLNDYSKNCDLCSLSKNSINCEFGQGNINGKIFFTSKDSSIYNDINTKAILDHIVDDIFKFNREDIYFTNLLKCEPRVISNDYKNEIDICIDYFYKQVDIVSPRVIFTFGDTIDYLTSTSNNILELSGNIYNYEGIVIIPVVSPLFLLKNPSYKDKIYNDLKKIKKKLEQL